MRARRRTTFTIAITVAALLCASMLAPAFGAPQSVSAATAASKLARALKLSKRADKNAKRALANSRKPGPAGADGAAGAKGEAGAKGDTGAAGSAGPAGATGAPGPAGANGDTGSAGAKGDRGDKGDAGSPGAKGDKGAPGEQGKPGADGAAGKDGSDGKDGADGATGPAGPSNGYVSTSTASVAWTISSTTQRTIALPAGHYILNAHAVADNSIAATHTASCAIFLGGENVSNASARIPADGLADRQTLAITGGGTLAAAGNAELRCQATNSGGDWIRTSLTAIKVGALN